MVMGDLCVRYTNLVDKYLPFMAASLQAGDGRSVEVNISSRLSITLSRKFNAYSMVKKNAIMLLSSLLLQDYIKWRGLLFHRFLAAVADEDDEVSQLAQTALCGPLLQKQPSLFANHFVGAVFVFNTCKAHPIYTAEASSGGSGFTVDFEGDSLAGSDGYQKRREVYEVMLANMNDEQKLEVTARLVKEVLGGALETSGDLSAVCKFSSDGIKSSTKLASGRIEAATNVLTDTLAVLTSPQIKVGRKGAEDAEDESLNGSRPDQRNAHKQRLLTRISRKHLMEIVIPILCNLKSVLESSHSPLLKNTMRYLGYIFRSYKSEVQEYLANQPTLLQELEYDTRQYEKNLKQRGRVGILPLEIVMDEPA
jgi:condensin-2 complex subunit D3